MNRLMLFIPLAIFAVMAAFLGGGIGREDKDVLPS
ncbi:MAG TPA: DsbE family thiol:disulfide interchange protein, partial [Oceanospirillales bacterium]|nr:DsbE family thiol:disulfide interchange protein [Oceanospirillales bacterium]